MTADDDVRLLSQAIERSGLSLRRFARDVLVRDPRTVTRWIKGQQPIPRAVRELLEKDAAAISPHIKQEKK